jgi:hypothetical protein
MSDITMCTGIGCPKRSRCRRAIARPSVKYQTYFLEPPNKGNTCVWFWEMKMNGKKKKK